MSVDLRHLVEPRIIDVYQRAETHSNVLLDGSKHTISQLLSNAGIDPNTLCFVAVGSVGRLEALESSDLDLIPIAVTRSALKDYLPHDKELREAVRKSLNGVKVSAGEDLTRATNISDLVSPGSIGGASDNSAALTKRMLILTESQQAGGEYGIKEVRRRILESYAAEARTRGRHVLSLCNDIARYYRTLCIEYKAKVDSEDKDWCTRNVKLRHSRKFWFFACMASIAEIAHRSPSDEHEYVGQLLSAFDECPRQRLISAVGDHCRVATASVLERFAFFLEFMSKDSHRLALGAVDHGTRYTVDMQNPFPMLKANSDLLHDALFSILADLPPDIRRRLLDWFLL